MSTSRSVVHLVPQLRLGVGRYVVDTALEQRREGWRVWVGVSASESGEWRNDPRLLAELGDGSVDVLEPGDFFHRSNTSLFETARALRSALPPAARQGVAHAHTAIAAAVARWAGIETVVATCHGWSLTRDQAFNLQDALAFGLVDAVTSPSAHWAHALRREMGVSEVSVIPVGLDLTRYPAPPTAAGASTPRRIVCLAELTARKGLSDLLDALPALWADAPDVELHLFGDGDARVALEQQAAGIDTRGKRVMFHGFVPRPFSRLHEFDLFCLPSRSDNYPVALMEAMLARLPVVSTSVGGIPELVTESGCGAVVSPEAPAELAAAISGILGLSAVERSGLGGRGERFIRERCAIGVTVRQLLALYAGARTRRTNSEGPSPCA